MKLATLKDGTRDGKLVVVSRDLTRFTDASFLVPTLQAALDDWQRIFPHLAAMAESLEHGSVPSARFHEHDAHSPLPRAYQRTGDGAVFTGPRDALLVAGGEARVDAACCAIVTDVAAGSARAAVRDKIVLVALSATCPESTSAFSPVVVTPDELDEAWDGSVELRLALSVNGKSRSASAVSVVDLSAKVAAAAALRPLLAGAIVDAKGTTATLATGDTLRIEMKDSHGHSIFGAIEQIVQKPGA